MRAALSVTESAEWLWVYVEQQGYVPVTYTPQYALLAVEDHCKSYPGALTTWWYHSASYEERQMFLTYWKQKCRLVSGRREHGLPEEVEYGNR